MEIENGILNLIALGIFGAAALLWVWTLIDILKNDFKKDINKIIWLIVVVFVPVGFIIYLLFGRGQKEEKSKE